MHYRQFIQKNDKENTITVVYSDDFKKANILYNDSFVDSINSNTELIHGKNINLPNGTEIFIKLKKKNIIVQENNKKLKPSPKDLNSKFYGAYGVAVFIAIVNILLSILVLFVDAKELNSFDPVGLFIFGIIFLILCLFIKRKSFIALLIATILFVSDMIISMLSGNVGILAVKIFFLISLIQGLIALPKMKKYTEHINKIVSESV